MSDTELSPQSPTASTPDSPSESPSDSTAALVVPPGNPSIPSAETVGAASPAAIPPAVTGPLGLPIFVDGSGRRKWLIRLAAVLIVLACAAYLYALTKLLTDDPSAAPHAVSPAVVVVGHAGSLGRSAIGS